MSKFTKGPWGYNNFEGCVYDFESELVCDLMTTGEAHEEANAHLIAAAPDMYKMLDKINNMGLVDFEIWRGKNRKIVTKLLSKARGES